MFPHLNQESRVKNETSNLPHNSMKSNNLNIIGPKIDNKNINNPIFSNNDDNDDESSGKIFKILPIALLVIVIIVIVIIALYSFLRKNENKNAYFYDENGNQDGSAKVVYIR